MDLFLIVYKSSLFPIVYISFTDTPNSLSTYQSTYVYVCRYICMYVCRYICMYVCMYICMCVCMYCISAVSRDMVLMEVMSWRFFTLYSSVE